MARYSPKATIAAAFAAAAAMSADNAKAQDYSHFRPVTWDPNGEFGLSAINYIQVDHIEDQWGNPMGAQVISEWRNGQLYAYVEYTLHLSEFGKAHEAGHLRQMLDGRFRYHTVTEKKRMEDDAECFAARNVPRNVAQQVYEWALKDPQTDPAHGSGSHRAAIIAECAGLVTTGTSDEYVWQNADNTPDPIGDLIARTNDRNNRSTPDPIAVCTGKQVGAFRVEDNARRCAARTGGCIEYGNDGLMRVKAPPLAPICE